MAGFPTVRLRRLRGAAPWREMVRETRVSARELIYPLFIAHGSGVRREIPSMPGCYHLSPDMVAAEAEEVARLGIPAVLLFGLPETKDPVGSGAYDPRGVVQQGIAAIKRAVPELMVVPDLCLCEYTDHGHCGVVVDGRVDNDRTLYLLARTAISHVEAGADMVSPSDMMDGRVGAIRQALDAKGFPDTPIMSYAAKFASSFFGPFRAAVDSAPQFGDRRSYQMDPANAREALREMALDAEEGADILMVKPAMPFLDIIARARAEFDLPIAAYQVSGEYAMLRAAGERGWLDERQAAMETLTSIKRAGADLTITYYAKEAARWLCEG